MVIDSRQSAEDSGIERRKHNRHKISRAAQVLVGRRSFAAIAYDISSEGFSFVLETKLTSGHVILRIPDAAITLEGAILDVPPQPIDSAYRYHVRLTKSLEPSFLSGLLDIES
jgi:hypothetical protein